MSVGASFLGGLGGGAIGSAVVKLYLDSAQYNSQLTSAEAKTKTATAQMGASTSKFGAIASTAYVAAATAAAAFVVGSVKQALEAQEAQAKLANSIENSAVVTEAAIPVFQAQAQAIRDLTGVDDDAINSMQGFLVQMGLTEDQITQLTPLVVDLSVKMGISLDAAAKAVGKSVNGTTTGLARMGVVVDKARAAADPFAATMEALGVASGFAADKAKQQPWILLRSKFEELQEEVGEKLLPALTNLAEDLLPLAEAVLPALADAIDTATLAFDGLHQVIAAIHGDMPDFQGNVLKAAETLNFLGSNNAAAAQAINDTQAALEAQARAADGAAGPLGDLNKLTEDQQALADAAAAELDELARAEERFARTVEDTFLSLGNTTKDVFDTTPRELDKMFDQMLANALRFKADMRILETLNFGLDPADQAAFVAWLETQAPGTIDAFVRSSRGRQQEWINDWARASDAVRNVVDNALPKEQTIKINVDTTFAEIKLDRLRDQLRTFG